MRGKRITAGAWLFLLISCCLCTAQWKLNDIPTGVVIPIVVTLADPQQSYALFLPSYYTPSRSWPIIYAFDPMARGITPTKLLKDAAEKYGYIVAGSNNARNGPIGPETEAAQAMWKDTHQRLAINEDRIYMTGFSGGARMATGLALQCKCVVGVFGHGAGFPARVPPSRQNQFLYFGAVGDADFNYPEMVELAKQLDDAGFTSRIRHFDGPHQWAPADVTMEAVEWFELHAIRKKGLLPANQEFISAQFEKASTQAKEIEAKGNTIGAYDSYRKVVQDFQGLKDISEFAAKAIEIGNSKEYRSAQKREQQEIKRQDALIADIARSSVTLRSDPGERQTVLMQLRGQLSNLRNAAQKQNDESKLTKRALNQAAVLLFENADEDLRKRDFALALIQYDLLGEIQPDSPRPLVQKARVYALSGEKKKAIATLRQASELGFKDFSQLKDNPDFASLTGDPEFKKLVNSTSQAGPVQQ